MSRLTASLFAIVFCGVGSLLALDTISDRGMWPDSWPKEMESLRKQSRTITGGLVQTTFYEIPFTRREEFETVWPHLLKVKSPGAPLILRAAPRKEQGELVNAGVRIWCPPSHPKGNATPASPIPGATSIRERWLWTTYIELVVDGEIVDLNRVPLPDETPIIDQRFAKPEAKPSN